MFRLFAFFLALVISFHTKWQWVEAITSNRLHLLWLLIGWILLLVTNLMPKLVIDPYDRFISLLWLNPVFKHQNTNRRTEEVRPHTHTMLCILTICGTENTQEKQTQAVCSAHPCPNKCALNKTVKTSPSSTSLLQTRNVNANTFNFNFLFGSLLIFIILSLAWRFNKLNFLSEKKMVYTFDFISIISPS